MTILQNFKQFGAVHWETGSVRHILNYQGANLSETLLLGITGGICVGYFSFAYQGHDPHLALLTRNTFDPLETLLDRLGVIREVRQTTNPVKGTENVLNALAEDHPVLVFADVCSLPYNAMPRADDMWLFMPVVVYGLDSESAYLSDRAAVPLIVSAEQFIQARGRTKDNKYKMMTLELPNLDKLARAVQSGIESCIRLYTEMPPKGARTNFGFAAFDHWAELLVKKSAKNSWAKVFPRGRALYAGLLSTYTSVVGNSTGGRASRDQYADFLDEAAAILNKPALGEAAIQFRQAATAWDALAQALLPDTVRPFKQTRVLLQRKSELFNRGGMTHLAEMQAIRDELEALKAQMSTDFPVDEAGCDELLDLIRQHVLTIRDVEQNAVTTLGLAMLTKK